MEKINSRRFEATIMAFMALPAAEKPSALARAHEKRFNVGVCEAALKQLDAEDRAALGEEFFAQLHALVMQLDLVIDIETDYLKNAG